MAIGDIQAGYTGIATIDGSAIRCSEFNVNATQTVEFYNHIVGLNDSLPATGDGTKGEVVGTIQTQRRIWRPSTINIGGGIGYPATTSSSGSSNISTLFTHAKFGTFFDIDFQYYCDPPTGRKARTFTDCRINSFTFSVTAGDILNIGSDVLCKKVVDSDIGSATVFTTEEKFITWDKVLITLTDTDSETGITDEIIRGFELNINNNATPIYTADPFASPADNDLLPFDIRIGTQEVSGSLSLYLKQGNDAITTTLVSPQTLTVSAEGFTTDISVVFETREIPGNIGPVLTTIPFVGVDKAFGA